MLPNTFVSRRHFQIRSQDGVHYVSDLDRTNGTYLNNERLVPNVERRVKDGAVTLVGQNANCST